MSEKRFTNVGGVEEFVHLIFDNETARTLSVKQTVQKLNTQQVIINELKERNAHNFAQNIQLKKEIKELKEEEKLYAKEIVRLNKNIEELNKTIEEALKFKSLGGDY